MKITQSHRNTVPSVACWRVERLSMVTVSSLLMGSLVAPCRYAGLIRWSLCFVLKVDYKDDSVSQKHSSKCFLLASRTPVNGHCY